MDGNRLPGDLEFADLLQAGCSDVKVLNGRPKLPADRPWTRPEIQVVVPGERALGQIAYQAAGGCVERRTISERQICIIPPALPHQLFWQRGNDLTVIRIAPEFIQRTAHGGDVRKAEIAGHYAVFDPVIWHLGREVRAELRRYQKLDGAYLHAMATVIARHLLSTYVTSVSTSLQIGGMPAFKLRNAIDFVHQNLASGISFREVAAHVNMSAYHFARMFKQSAGVSPHNYIVRCRMERAKTLLAEVSLPISDVAFEVGYKSRSHFTTSFRRLTGATPAEFRAGK